VTLELAIADQAGQVTTTGQAVVKLHNKGRTNIRS